MTDTADIAFIIIGVYLCVVSTIVAIDTHKIAEQEQQVITVEVTK